MNWYSSMLRPPGRFLVGYLDGGWRLMRGGGRRISGTWSAMTGAVSGLGAWVVRTCGAVWHWFYEGRGRDILSWTSAIVLIILVVYQVARVCPTVGGVILAIIIIMVMAEVVEFVWLFILGLTWLIMPVAAVVGMFLIGLVGIATVIVVGSVYLAMLILVTGILGLVFVLGAGVFAALLALFGVVATVLFIPIIAGGIAFAAWLIGLVGLQLVLLVPFALAYFGHEVSLLYRNISFHCPTSGCAEKRLPLHECPVCHKRYLDLKPNLYGLLYHRCDHPGATYKLLPTFDRLGRRDLPRVCRRCETPLMGSIGMYPERLVAIAGGPSSGKTVYLLSVIEELVSGTSFNGTPMRAEIDLSQQTEEFERQRELLDSGLPPAKTTGAAPDAFLLALERGRRKNLLYLYDAPGEQFGSIELFGLMKHVEDLHALLVLVDPFSLEEFRPLAENLDEGIAPSETPLQEVVQATVATAERMMGEGARSVPVAVVVTKTDVPVIQQRLAESAQGGEDGELYERALEEWGAEAELRALKLSFGAVECFGCSPLGRTPSSGDDSPFVAQGVLDPLAWVLQASD